LIYTNKEIGLIISIDDALLSNLIDTGIQHHPNEFGGFLIGYYSGNQKQLNITDTILPTKYKATPYLFERDTVGVEEKLRVFYSETPQKYYVGEWHSHPNNLPIPSSTDIKAINTITNHKEVSIKSPAMLIIGYDKTKIALGFYAQFKNKLYKYEKN
jgi:integrative and conjugative element protein (TIGR02256 family)